MTWRKWMGVRKLLFEEQMGTHLRSRDNRKSDEYRQSVARLRAAQARQAKEQ